MHLHRDVTRGLFAHHNPVISSVSAVMNPPQPGDPSYDLWVKEREVPLNRSHGIVVSLNWAVRPCGPVFVTFEEDLKDKRR